MAFADKSNRGMVTQGTRASDKRYIMLFFLFIYLISQIECSQLHSLVIYLDFLNNGFILFSPQGPSVYSHLFFIFLNFFNKKERKKIIKSLDGDICLS